MGRLHWAASSHHQRKVVAIRGGEGGRVWVGWSKLGRWGLQAPSAFSCLILRFASTLDASVDWLGLLPMLGQCLISLCSAVMVIRSPLPLARRPVQLPDCRTALCLSAWGGCIHLHLQRLGSLSDRCW